MQSCRVGYSLKITQIEKTAAFQNVHLVEAKQIYDTENATVIHMSLQPGQSLKKHTTAVDVFFYILEGKGTVEIGDEQQEVQKDVCLSKAPKVFRTFCEIQERVSLGF
jgi:quercetin dioxygenase-like cupin family protein